MFYHPEVLRRHTGFFGTIWLAATCSSRLLRREYMGVDVPRVCASVLSFVLGRGLLGALPSPPPPGAPPPRCSLYLAALLQLGLARVYGRQCGQLLEEASLILERLHRARPPPNIDISPPRRPQLVGDARALMATLESAPDPFFGLMEGALPSPTALPHVQRLLEELPPPPGERCPTRCDPQVPAGPPITVSPELITLREPEAPRPAEIERYGAQEGLPEVTARELELLSEAEVELLPPAPEIAELPAPPPVPLVPRVPEEPSLPLAPEVPPFRRPLRDRRPQLEERGFRERLEEPRGQCRALEVLPPPRDQRRRARDLLSAPLLAAPRAVGPVEPLRPPHGASSSSPAPPGAPGAAERRGGEASAP
ncbi:meiotic recombination protein REC8 homolog [Phaenicophaeus curvirostris]|uniref:meiotic recombination protein REC8 homolog n=1 Tax=Phaenicophaeus curvirostris TaxID=33595 RepID=UPI0037F0A4C2